METRGVLLREALRLTGTTQKRLSQMTGVPQSRISTYVNDKQGLSEDMLIRLVQPLGMMVERRLRFVEPELTRQERLSWRFHLRLGELLNDRSTLHEWRPKLLENIDKQHRTTTGNGDYIDRWQRLVQNEDLQGLRQVMSDPGPDGIRMREVTPFIGLLPQTDRHRILQETPR